MRRTLLLMICTISLVARSASIVPAQSVATLAVTDSCSATVVASTNQGSYSFYLDNTGQRDVSEAMQAMFDQLAALEDVSATVTLVPGIYYVNKPVRITMAGIKIVGQGHGGIDIHGANLATGTIFLLGKACAPNCFTFEGAGRKASFPSGEAPWHNQNLKVELENLTFVGYNNTGVDTAHGYSRFRGDKPNFRGLHWYPGEGRYEDVERDGQRAICLPAQRSVNGGYSKCELLRVTGCYFTDLYVAIDVHACDVSYLNKNWFGQLTYAIRYTQSGQGMMVSDNLFADLETAFVLGHPIFSTFSNNTFAYISKAFEIDQITNSTITGNTIYNWKISTGAAAYGSFIHARKSTDLIVSNNTITQQLDSRKRERTTDAEPNGESFVQFEQAQRLMFTHNILNTIISQTVVRLESCTDCVVADNIITHAEGGNAVAETGDCARNYYRPIAPEQSAPFNAYIY